MLISGGSLLFSCVLLIRAVVSFTTDYSHCSWNLQHYNKPGGAIAGFITLQGGNVLKRAWQKQDSSHQWIAVLVKICRNRSVKTFPQEMDQKLLSLTCEEAEVWLSEGCGTLKAHSLHITSVYTKSAGQKIICVWAMYKTFITYSLLEDSLPAFLFTLPLGCHHLIINSSKKRYSLWIEIWLGVMKVKVRLKYMIFFFFMNKFCK